MRVEFSRSPREQLVCVAGVLGSLTVREQLVRRCGRVLVRESPGTSWFAGVDGVFDSRTAQEQLLCRCGRAFWLANHSKAVGLKVWMGFSVRKPLESRRLQVWAGLLALKALESSWFAGGDGVFDSLTVRLQLRTGFSFSSSCFAGEEEGFG
ncbi:hypothetical protein AVEN_138957-1 [Araneus ventricosus]|uniref:Uncharacterized protein n=1 Tax=Araneus ventricosus TaxID=182803 RepID=A0A4Y2BYK8_ARAVE|nr:hypothetical protein AVEN_138957-1 [Araneus ventricosus]